MLRAGLITAHEVSASCIVSPAPPTNYRNLRDVLTPHSAQSGGASGVAMSPLSRFCLLCLVLIGHTLDGARIRKKIKITPSTPVRNHGPRPDVTSRHSGRQRRFLNPFSLFNVVQFPNTECTTSSGSQGKDRVNYSHYIILEFFNLHIAMH